MENIRFKDPDSICIDFKQAYDMIMAAKDIKIDSKAVNLLPAYIADPHKFDPALLYGILRRDILNNWQPSVPYEDVHDIFGRLDKGPDSIGPDIRHALDYLDEHSLKIDPSAELIALFNNNLDYYLRLQTMPGVIDFIATTWEALAKSPNKSVADAASALAKLYGNLAAATGDQSDEPVTQYENFATWYRALTAMREANAKFTTPPVPAGVKDIFTKVCDVIERQFNNSLKNSMGEYMKDELQRLEDMLRNIPAPAKNGSNKDQILQDFSNLRKDAEVVRNEMIQLWNFFNTFPENKVAWDALVERMRQFADNFNVRAEGF